MKTRKRGTHHDLFSLGEVVRGVLVQLHDAEFLQRRKLFRDNLGRVQDIKAESEGLVLVDDLDGQFPLGRVAGGDGVEQIGTVRIGILAGEDLGFLPVETGSPLFRLPVPLDELRHARVGD